MHHADLQPNPWMIMPFGILLAAIALAPLFFANWWNKHYPKVAYLLGAVTLGYYLLSLQAYTRITHTALEYVSFIALIGSLFVVSGGIHIRVKGEATPTANVIFLLFGAIIANILGTTGASMLLIRPWLRMNKYRITAHHVVFFIFIVSNVGGCLTPIGDPPLFLGYLQGIPFWWVAENCWRIWAAGIGMLLTTFFVIDYLNYRRAPKAVRETLAERPEEWRVDGVSNLFFLGIILGSVFIKEPPLLRELLMVGAAAGSYFTTRKSVHQSNDFNFHPIQEVAVLFAGIFATMMPALDWLQANAGQLGAPTPALFYWACGALSSMLDNAPTYLSFLSAIFGVFVNQELVAQVKQLVESGGPLSQELLTGQYSEQIKLTYLALAKYHAAAVASGNVTERQIEIAYLLGNPGLNKFIVAISASSVFFGASTYIGNGPNFMVKSIAHQSKVHHVPTFLGYVFKYSLPFLLPMLFVVWLIFFSR